MKKLFLIFLAFISLQNLLSQSLAYTPFPMDSASWWSESTFGSYESSNETKYHFFFKSIYETKNGHQYATLYRESGGYITPHNVFPPRTDSSYTAPEKYALLREENKRVYMILANDSVEKVLYDFNIALGDSVVQQTDFGLYQFVLTKIDSILIKNEYRNRYTYRKIPPPYIGEPTFKVEIVEGIGSITNYLVEPFNFVYFSNSNASISKSFVSFCQKGEPIYGTDCDFHLPKIIVPYHSFPTQNVKWFSFYRDYHDYDTPPKRNFTSVLYTFNGESFTQNGNEYHAFVEESGTQNFTYSLNSYDSSYQYNGKKVIGGFREKEKKVYFWDNAKNAERLLYDFTLVKGDTFYYEGKKLTVLDTFPTVIAGKYYKNMRLKLEDSQIYQVYNVIEGAGATQFAPHLPYVENQLFDNNSHLTKDQLFDAFCKNDTLLIRNYFVTDCNAEIPKPANLPILLPEETLSPNPVAAFTYLHLKNTNGLEPKIEIFDILGNKVQSIDLQSDALEIDAQNLPNGIYFVRYISTTEHRFIGKMWVKH
jgi:hypothetical protein